MPAATMRRHDHSNRYSGLMPMSGTSLVWIDGGALRALNVDHLAAAVVIGRSSRAEIHLTDESVSRQHALLRISPDGDWLENLSRTNTTQLNGTRVDTPVALVDGDVLRVGRIEIGYHNLATASRVSGPFCSYCNRENPPTQKDCWFCGTSLVGARSDVRARTPLLLRVAGPPQQQPSDVFPGEILAFDAEGKPSVVREEGAGTAQLAIASTADGARLRYGGGHPQVKLNDVLVLADTDVTSGDRLEIGGQAMIILTNG
ncbi:MAG: FHA domain-containing protein [Candidatus Limnocylindria bacterium]